MFFTENKQNVIIIIIIIIIIVVGCQIVNFWENKTSSSFVIRENISIPKNSPPILKNLAWCLKENVRNFKKTVNLLVMR